MFSLESSGTSGLDAGEEPRPDSPPKAGAEEEEEEPVPQRVEIRLLKMSTNGFDNCCVSAKGEHVEVYVKECEMTCHARTVDIKPFPEKVACCVRAEDSAQVELLRCRNGGIRSYVSGSGRILTQGFVLCPGGGLGGAAAL